ncbi:U3 small nucleolar RNA-associated protein 14 A [Phytophthora pseudosyringae]|uniref:U3 small nucleolar RNA-associated protein 14 A n=1 Tax=Phytophthora pseudosyringae TaxID=221518 RepID=A0A8T1V734_9STRA|nr:U3 small nucleolar RNA-associated protein 14 A [Phytophthora pseudosyringae]
MERVVKKLSSKLYRAPQYNKIMADLKEMRARNPELAYNLVVDLAEERVTLKNRNNSKWVKHQLRRRALDDDTRCSSIHNELRRGEELLRKMNRDEFDDDTNDEKGNFA